MRCLSLFLLFCAIPSAFAQTSPPFPTSLASALESIRAKYKLPALAGAIFTTNGLVEEAAVGVRKAGTDIPVTTGDKWHLGSDTKAMTATVVGTFVNEGKLSWDSDVISFFPEMAGKVPPSMRNITLGQILSHEAGMKETMEWKNIGTVQQQRLLSSEQALTAPAYQPGTYHYSNTDYVIIAAILEKISGKSWEELIGERLFKPLQMRSAGFGRAATAGKLDQPWPHLENGRPMPECGYLAGKEYVAGESELPKILAPAGLVHCDMADWAKFLTDQLRGAVGLSALLPTSIYQAMQTPQPNSIYGYGWGVVEANWADGKLITHDGSDGMNYAKCCLLPGKKFGVLVCTNQGDAAAAQACNESVNALILRYLNKP
jgi:CubicO group peptidase (beta-lactamase class C family)